ncbi:MAG: hypothetical protein R3D00_19530 [Bacteroidia bacterium]
MTPEEEEKRIAEAVARQLQLLATQQQEQWSHSLESVIKNALSGVDKARAALAQERKAVEKELDAARLLRKKAENEGEKMAAEAFEAHRIQYEEATRTELLRNLCRMHIETGKSNRDIAVWLDVPQDFVGNIRQLLQRTEQYHTDKPKRTHLEGNPKVWLSGNGRGGEVHFESRETSFACWWEFGAYGTFIIVEIPTKEKWEDLTQLPLEKRNAVLNFIGEHIVISETSNKGSFIIGDNVLTVFAEVATKS